VSNNAHLIYQNILTVRSHKISLRELRIKLTYEMINTFPQK